MKKLMTVLSLLLVICIQLATAAPHNDIPFLVEKSFEQKFPAAANVEWKKINDVFIGSFTWNGENLRVYYNEEGEFIGSGKSIAVESLPSIIAKQASRSYKNYSTTAAFEIRSELQGMLYYLQLENEKAVLLVQVNGRSVSIMQKFKK